MDEGLDGGGMTRSLFPAAGVLLLCGMTLVVFSRGCDVVNKRQTARLAAVLELEKAEFRDEYEAKVTDAQNKLEGGDLRDKLEKLETEHDKASEGKKLKWRDMEIDARDARRHANAWAYWLEWLFLFGTLALCFGLVALALHGLGAQRWVALAILGIIIFSIYVGGMAWVSTIVLPG